MSGHNEVLVPCSVCPNWFWVSAEHLADVHHEGPPVSCDWCHSEFRFSLQGDVVKQGDWPRKPAALAVSA